MEVIPVIDLKRGEVVRARAGRRDEYQPLKPSSVPAEVVAGLLRLFPFRRCYAADLDAIERHGEHDAVLQTLAAVHKNLEFWVDNGIGDAAAAEAWLARGIGTLVLGSESQAGTAILHALAGHPRVVLSLDFRDDAFLGPGAILEDPRLWPPRVIVMTLSRVGAGQGPDLDRLADIRRRAPGRRVYAAGGVRNAADLTALSGIGVAGALVATALHSGAITAAELASFARPEGRARTPG